MRTFMGKPDQPAQWFLVDARGQILGRLASRVAAVLRGKARPTFTPSVSGDYVIIINAEKIWLTGRKLQQKMYYRHSGYPGGLRSTPAGKLLQRRPEMLLKEAVKGMLPKNPLGRECLGKLKVYRGEAHRHAAQQPVALTFPRRPGSASTKGRDA
ncbi:MAG TPA: 50S ribosomal protein L13 [bacterium]|nr:50S ribosomal protein L13 [bacterium]